ncbi:MAG: hypothetical protein B6D71_07695, partial [gamma proteobacterium symbiont of Stewartia floridana]
WITKPPLKISVAYHLPVETDRFQAQITVDGPTQVCSVTLKSTIFATGSMSEVNFPGLDEKNHASTEDSH